MGHVNADEILVAELAEARENLAVMTEEASRLEALLEQRATGEADAAIRIAYLEERVLELQLALRRQFVDGERGQLWDIRVEHPGRPTRVLRDILGAAECESALQAAERVVRERDDARAAFASAGASTDLMLEARKQEQAVRDADLRAVHARLAVNGAALPEGPMFDAVLAGIDDLGSRAARTVPGKNYAEAWRSWAQKVLGMQSDGPFTYADDTLRESVGRAVSERQDQLTMWRQGAAKLLRLDPDGTLDDDKELLYSLSKARWASSGPSAIALNNLDRLRVGIAAALGKPQGVHADDDLERGVRDQRIALESARTGLDTIARRVTAFEGNTVLQKVHNAVAALMRLRDGIMSICGTSSSDESRLAQLQKLSEEREDAIAKLKRWEEAGTPYLITCPERLAAAIELGKDTETMLKGELTEVREYLAEALDSWSGWDIGSGHGHHRDRIAELRKHAAPNPRPAPIETAEAS